MQAYLDCPRRFEFGLRRHTEAGESPEAQGPNTAYGSAVHDAIAYVEENDASDEEGIQHAVKQYGRWLDPDDVQRLRDDLAVYHERDYVGVDTVAVEREVRMPLFVHRGQQIYLRGRLDRVYQRRDNPSVFVHIDYKSSKWPRTEKEVHEDRQLWSYNLLIHEEWPECETLVQVYDQLVHGPLTTRKSEAQREQIREWLILQITAILEDEELAPTKNEWCPWCPIMESCPVVRDLSRFATATIAALAPAEKQGRKTVLNLDEAMFDIYVEQLDDVALAQKVLKRFDESVRDVLRAMPDARRRELGYRLSPRGREVFTPPALRSAHELLGDEFYELIGLSKTAVERLQDKEQVDALLALTERHEGAPALTKTD